MIFTKYNYIVDYINTWPPESLTFITSDDLRKTRYTRILNVHTPIRSVP